MTLSPLDRFRAWPRDEQDAYLATLDPDQLDDLLHERWTVAARPEQQPPDGDWLVWFIRAGRGFGKTRTGAEWLVERHRTLSARGATGLRFALVAPTLEDVRLTMVEGESGLRRCLPRSLWRDDSWERTFNRGPCELHLNDGTFAKGYSSEVPGKLRGPQHHAAWVDEPAQLRDANVGTSEDSTWSNLMLGLRLPPDPRAIVTGTPKNNALTRALMTDPGVVVTVGSTYDNLQNLSPQFRDQVVARYEGTRLGRQELHAEILDSGGTLFQRHWFRVVDTKPEEPGWRWVRCWDLAATEPSDSNTDPDWTAGALVGHHQPSGRWCIAHVERFRSTPGARDAQLRVVAEQDRLPVCWVEQEGGSAGKSVIHHLARSLATVVRVRGYRPTGPKVHRAELVATHAEHGDVEVVAGPWVDALFDELDDFPDGAHDDQVDALSMCFDVLSERGGPARTAARGVPASRLPAMPVR